MHAKNYPARLHTRAVIDSRVLWPTKHVLGTAAFGCSVQRNSTPSTLAAIATVPELAISRSSQRKPLQKSARRLIHDPPHKRKRTAECSYGPCEFDPCKSVKIRGKNSSAVLRRPHRHRDVRHAHHQAVRHARAHGHHRHQDARRGHDRRRGLRRADDLHRQRSREAARRD
jgi:hypothetical protein